MRFRLGAGAIGAEASPPPTPASDAAAAPGTASGLLMAALAGALLLSVLAGIHVSRPGPAGADIHVSPDDAAGVVLCVVDAASQARCFGKDRVLSGALDGRSPALCGLADRPLASPCPNGGGACAFRQVALPSGAFGLVLLEPRPSLFGVPSHRLIDTAVLAPSAAAAAPQIAAGVQRLARCFAPSAPPVDVDVVHRACEDGPCRLRHSSVRVAVQRPVPAANR